MVLNDTIKANIITLLNLDNIADADKVALIDKMTEVVSKRILLRIGERLAEEERRDFIKLMDDGSDDALQNFFDRQAPDLLEIIGEETLKLKDEMAKHLAGG